MVQAQVGVHLFEPLILGLEFLEAALGVVLVGDFLLLPPVEGGGADLVFAAQFGDRRTGVPASCSAMMPRRCWVENLL